MCRFKLISWACLTAVSAVFFGCSLTDNRYYLYVGTYTDGESEGLYVAEFDPVKLTLSEVRLAAELNQCTYQDINLDNTVLFSTGVMDELGENNGVLKSFKIESDGSLTEISTRPTEKSPVLAHVKYSDRLGFVFTTSYHGGQVYSYPVDSKGAIGEEAGFAQHEGGSNAVPDRQDKAHPHSVFVHPYRPFIYVPDLGKDAVVVYAIDETSGSFTEIEDSPHFHTGPGSGPRHMAFHSASQYVYINNELNSTIHMAGINNKRGKLGFMETHSTIPKSFTEPPTPQLQRPLCK